MRKSSKLLGRVLGGLVWWISLIRILCLVKRVSRSGTEILLGLSGQPYREVLEESDGYKNNPGHIFELQSRIEKFKKREECMWR